MPRRGLLAGMLAFALAILPVPTAHALDANGASVLIGALTRDINNVINSGKSERAMLSEFEVIFTTYGDVPIIAQRALGADWRRASGGQRNAFTGAFSDYISCKYGKRFREFIGGEIEVTSARPVKSFFEVVSIAHLRGQAPFEVRWHVSDKSGAPKMFNMFIEGINMMTSEATEIGAMLDKRKGNIDQLIADLPATTCP